MPITEKRENIVAKWDEMKERDSDEILQFDQTEVKKKERLFPEGRCFKGTAHWFKGGNLEEPEEASGW